MNKVGREREKSLETCKLGKSNNEVVGFVYPPARFPADKMAMMGVRVRAWIWARPQKRSLSSAIARITGGVVNIVPRKLGEKMGACWGCGEAEETRASIP